MSCRLLLLWVFFVHCPPDVEILHPVEPRPSVVVLDAGDVPVDDAPELLVAHPQPVRGLLTVQISGDHFDFHKVKFDNVITYALSLI